MSGNAHRSLPPLLREPGGPADQEAMGPCWAGAAARPVRGAGLCLSQEGPGSAASWQCLSALACAKPKAGHDGCGITKTQLWGSHCSVGTRDLPPRRAGAPHPVHSPGLTRQSTYIATRPRGGGHQRQHARTLLGMPPIPCPCWCPQQPRASTKQWVKGEEGQGVLWDPISLSLTCLTPPQLAPRALGRATHTHVSTLTSG